MRLSTYGKYVDQPIILNKLHKHMPKFLIGTGTGFWAVDSFKHNDSRNEENQNRRKHHKTHKALKHAIVISTTIGASLIGTRGLKVKGKQIVKGLMEYTPLEKVQEKQTKAVNEYIKNTKPKNKDVLDALERAKTKEILPKQIELLTTHLKNSKDKEKLFDVILPEKKNLKSKEIFSEIKRLSLIGLIPVAGGVGGGILADKLTHTNSKKGTANKVKEGLYQYLANIFLCNVGAGTALFLSERMEKAKMIKPLTPMKKLVVILAGITATGIVGGSYIANYISKKCINPLFGDNKNPKGVYGERKPEALDIALHADDIATAGVLSGFKWIEPALPFMYFISGYRAGIGYRNGEPAKHHH